MKYSFTISQLEILNNLIFDSSIEFVDLQRQAINGQIEYHIERRSFENVKRSKFLFINFTHFKGIASILRLSGLKRIELSGIDDKFLNNHFINKIQYDLQSDIVKLETAFSLSILYHIESDFHIELEDINESDFGDGSHFGLHGFTSDEWNKYLIDKNYDLQQRV